MLNITKRRIGGIYELFSEARLYAVSLLLVAVLAGAKDRHFQPTESSD